MSNKIEIDFLDLFSGIGGFSLGFQQAGFTIKNHYYSEIDKNAIANYSYNFKNSIYAGAIENIRGTSLGKVDIITFGSPCQDFSVAGKGEGLNGKRSNLIQEAIRLITEKKPSFFIWENVKGAFSTNDRADFWAIIQAFTNIGLYRLEWQLLNTLWIHPQSRERIYLVGHLATHGRDFKPVFPISENDRLFEETGKTNESQQQTQHCGTIGTKSNRASNTFIKANRFSKKQQDRIYEVDGAMGCLTKDRTNDKTKIRIAAMRNRGDQNIQNIEFNEKNTNTLTSVQKDNLLCISTHKRNGDPSKGGTGLLKNDSGSTFCIDTQNNQAIYYEDTYRKLTEIECERLQGFPDNWTKYGSYNSERKIIASTNRYSLIGNSITVDFPRRIAEKLIENYY